MASISTSSSLSSTLDLAATGGTGFAFNVLVCTRSLYSIWNKVISINIGFKKKKKEVFTHGTTNKH